MLRASVESATDESPETADDLRLSKSFNLAKYTKAVHKHFAKHQGHYLIDGAQARTVHDKYDRHLAALTTSLIKDSPPVESSKQRKAAAAVAKAPPTLDLAGVFKLLVEHDIRKFTQSLITFVQSVEDHVRKFVRVNTSPPN